MCHALVLMCDKGNDSVLLHLQGCRSSYLQVLVGRACRVQHWGCRGAVTVTFIQGLSTHLWWRQLIRRWFSRWLLSLVLTSTEDASKMAAHYLTPLSRCQPAAHPFPASRFSWELTCSVTQSCCLTSLRPSQQELCLISWMTSTPGWHKACGAEWCPLLCLLSGKSHGCREGNQELRQDCLRLAKAPDTDNRNPWSSTRLFPHKLPR